MSGSNWACTLCGRTDWPRTTTSCPLCYEEPEKECEDDQEEPEPEKQIDNECCDRPRGFVGGICDNCDGVVQPEPK